MIDTTGAQPVGPRSPVAVLEPWIASRLAPLDAVIADAAPRGDYDLNPDHRPARDKPLAEAAVLVPLVERPGGLTVLLTRRADTLRRHSGQVAFPGGRCDPGETVVETALREAEEEVALDRAFVRPVGLSDPYETGTGFRIAPVVAFVREGFTLRAATAEVADVFETPFAWLMDAANHQRRHHDGADGLRRHFYAMPWEDRLIWGATAGMLRGLYERLFG